MADIVKIKYQVNLKNAALLAGQELDLPINAGDLLTHKFMNELVVVNVSNSDILITPDMNTDKSFLVPAKGSYTWSFKDDNFKYSAIRYKEMSSAAVSANTIYFTLIKKRYEVGVE